MTMSRVKSYLFYILIYHILPLCILFFHGSRALHQPRGLTYTYTERTDVHFTNIIYPTSKDRETRSTDRRPGKDRETRSTEDRLPKSLNVHFRVNENPINLHLYKNHKLSSDVPIYLHHATGIGRHWTSDQTPSAFYQDGEHMASFHVECLNNTDEWNCTELELFGTFYIEDEFYILESETDYSYSSKRTHPYIISQPHVPLHFYNDQLSAEHLRSRSSSDGRTGRRRRASGTYTVELFVVTDYSVYKYWYDASSQTTNEGKRIDARNKIKTFVAFHINGIDARFALMNAEYTIDVTFAGLYIAESVTSSSWTETVKTVDGTVNVVPVINNFMLWVQSEVQAGNIPTHDHAMLFSRYDFKSNGNNDNIGYAYQGAMCTASSQSIVEDQFNFVVETTAAHELGHSLGAKHDGIDNVCIAENAYIMAASTSAKIGSNARHPWIFSTCSASEIDSLLNSLLSKGNNCLQTTNSQTNPSELSPYTATEIGQLFDVNHQCEEAVGQGSYICLQFYTDFETICTGLWCNSPSSTQCSLIIPADGTTCNSSKWCKQGECVTSSGAPVLPSTCLYGDSKGVVYNNYTCGDIQTKAPWSCYSYNASCCVTCQALYTGPNGCEYGDRANCTGVTGSQCYAGTNANICCQTCLEFYTAVPGCEYGDRANCTGVTGSQCYAGNNANTCCQTCLNFYTAIPGCLYGDKASGGCKQSNCPFYTASGLDSCCLTCYQGTLPATQVSLPPTTQGQSTTTTPTSTIAPATTDLQTTVDGNTTSPAANNLPAWIIPVAATASGIVIVLVLVGILCYCQRTRKPRTPRPPARGPSTISWNEFGGARPASFNGITNVAYQVASVPGTDHYNYISPDKVSGPRISAVSRQLPPPARPPPRRPPQPIPSIKPGTASIRTTENTPHEYVDITEYQGLQSRQSTKSTAYESLKYSTKGVVNARA